MFSIKLIVVAFALFACVFAEPPRKQRLNFRFGARQEAAGDADANAPESQGYDYSPPAERLRLPIKFRPFARQEESAGYSYPKPTNGYGVPEESGTTEPSTDYGTPEETTTAVDDYDQETTDNPLAERLKGIQASQLRRKNAKLSRNQKSQQFKAQLITSNAQFQPQVQPVFFVQYPTADDFVQPQYVYLLK